MNLVDQADLDEFELGMSLLRAEQPWPKGPLDAAHSCRMHHHLFQDVYDWAGQYRRIRIGKAGNWFCYPDHIGLQMEQLFAALAAHGHFLGMDLEAFRTHSTEFLSDLNANHPFRDGNGRTQMAFIALLASRAGYRFAAEALEPEIVMDAMIQSFSGRNQPLRQLMSNLIV